LGFMDFINKIIIDRWLDFLIFSLWSIPLFVILYLVASYAGDKSKLYGLKPIIYYLPIIKKPKGHVHFRQKLLWTITVLLLYFGLTNIYLYGVDQEKVVDLFASFRAIMAGATESGATTFLLSHDIDTGDVLGQVRLEIGADENAGSLHDRILDAGKHLLAETVDDLAEGVAEVKPQSEFILGESELLEAPKLFKEDRIIDWNCSSTDIHNLIRGLSPYPGAITYLPEAEKDPIKILSTRQSDIKGLAPGEILIKEGRMFVGTGEKGIEILTIQPPGKGSMEVVAYLLGKRTGLNLFVS